MLLNDFFKMVVIVVVKAISSMWKVSDQPSGGLLMPLGWDEFSASVVLELQRKEGKAAAPSLPSVLDSLGFTNIGQPSLWQSSNFHLGGKDAFCARPQRNIFD